MMMMIIILIIIIIIIIDLSKQQALGSDPETIDQINFTEKLEANETIFVVLQKVKETILDFSHATMRVLWIYFVLI